MTLLFMNELPDHIYFPVEGVRFPDLYDWNEPGQKCKVTSGTVRKLQRQSSLTGRLLKLNETQVALFRHGETVYAINEKCPHAGGPLHVGDIEMLPDKSLCVRCPWHSWRWDLKTGKLKQPKGRDKQAVVYPVKVDPEGNISIGFDEFSPSYFSTENDF